MAGSSLWLTPPPTHPLHAAISKLIETTLPALMQVVVAGAGVPPRPPSFSPHLTLTSGISPDVYGAQPQKWLDSIAFPAAPQVAVRFERVSTEDVYFRRCYIKCGFDGVRDVAAVARARGVEGEATVGPRTRAWLSEWREAFGPHVSLMYGDTPIDEGRLREIEEAVRQSGVGLGDSSTRGLSGWEGGVVWLVSTEKSIDQWKPIATRIL